MGFRGTGAEKQEAELEEQVPQEKGGVDVTQAWS